MPGQSIASIPRCVFKCAAAIQIQGRRFIVTEYQNVESPILIEIAKHRLAGAARIAGETSGSSDINERSGSCIAVQTALAPGKIVRECEDRLLRRMIQIAIYGDEQIRESIAVEVAQGRTRAHF